LRSSYAWCERLARRQAGNFYPAFRVLPAAQRRAMCALYAFMRISDDLADEPADVEIKRRQLKSWRGQLHEALDGHLIHPSHPAIRDCVKRYSIPARYFEDVLDGVEMDLQPV